MGMATSPIEPRKTAVDALAGLNGEITHPRAMNAILGDFEALETKIESSLPVQDGKIRLRGREIRQNGRCSQRKERRERIASNNESPMKSL